VVAEAGGKQCRKKDDVIGVLERETVQGGNELNSGVKDVSDNAVVSWLRFGVQRSLVEEDIPIQGKNEKMTL